MLLKINLLSMLFLALCATDSVAGSVQKHSQQIPFICSETEYDDECVWWGYFKGDYSSVTGQGIGSGTDYPLTYNNAIKIERTNPEVLGKRIKAVKFALLSTDYIQDVKIWMSTMLPLIAEDADICCENVDNESLVSLENQDKVNTIAFTEPYQFGSADVYVGYSFTVTSEEAGTNMYPVAVIDNETAANALYIDWGMGWNDFSGSDFGNLALMIQLDDDGIFIPGDVNYDVKVNVGDVAATTEYVLNGSVNPFNKDMADIDGNKEINVVDVASIVDIILGKYKKTDTAGSLLCNEELSVYGYADKTEVSLMTDKEYKAFQMDVCLEHGLDITSVRLNPSITSTHSFKCSKIEDGRYRIVVYSASGACIKQNTENLLTIITDDDVQLENVIFATSELEEKRFDKVNYTDVTGIDNVEYLRNDDCIYNINGNKIDADDILHRGIYIKNNKKIMVK